MCIRVALRPGNVKTACKQLRAQSAKCYELHAFARPSCLPLYTRGYRQVMLLQLSILTELGVGGPGGTQVMATGLPMSWACWLLHPSAEPWSRTNTQPFYPRFFLGRTSLVTLVHVARSIKSSNAFESLSAFGRLPRLGYPSPYSPILTITSSML